MSTVLIVKCGLSSFEILTLNGKDSSHYRENSSYTPILINIESIRNIFMRISVILQVIGRNNGMINTFSDTYPLFKYFFYTCNIYRTLYTNVMSSGLSSCTNRFSKPDPNASPIHCFFGRPRLVGSQLRL